MKLEELKLRMKVFVRLPRFKAKGVQTSFMAHVERLEVPNMPGFVTVRCERHGRQDTRTVLPEWLTKYEEPTT